MPMRTYLHGGERRRDIGSIFFPFIVTQHKRIPSKEQCIWLAVLQNRENKSKTKTNRRSNSFTSTDMERWASPACERYSRWCCFAENAWISIQICRSPISYPISIVLGVDTWRCQRMVLCPGIFCAIFTRRKINHCNAEPLGAPSWNLPVNIVQIVDEVSQIDWRLREIAQQWYWFRSQHSPSTPITKVPR